VRTDFGGRESGKRRRNWAVFRILVHIRSESGLGDLGSVAHSGFALNIDVNPAWAVFFVAFSGFSSSCRGSAGGSVAALPMGARKPKGRRGRVSISRMKRRIESELRAMEDIHPPVGTGRGRVIDGFEVAGRLAT
jgi:hypothetical protein